MCANMDRMSKATKTTQNNIEQNDSISYIVVGYLNNINQHNLRYSPSKVDKP